ncbi:hypothetical protein [Reyranella sp. CPCC 100927]|uniref:hypothetical protein n=1 Tax=Reyranella sp. CPCC 100927 TaxID=2599616 RepID=UPI0015B45752|nr:hypothetical protein [Reyranella sp. CPCC 100927]
MVGFSAKAADQLAYKDFNAADCGLGMGSPPFVGDSAHGALSFVKPYGKVRAMRECSETRDLLAVAVPQRDRSAVTTVAM